MITTEISFEKQYNEGNKTCTSESLSAKVNAKVLYVPQVGRLAGRHYEILTLPRPLSPNTNNYHYHLFAALPLTRSS